MAEILYGRNAVRESLHARRRHFHRLIVAENVQSSAVIDEIHQLAQQNKVPTYQATRKELSQLAKGHQGVVLEVGLYPVVDLEDIFRHAQERNQPPFIVVLDHLEDPHNVGAILRTAEATGVHGIIIPKQRAAGVTPAVISASAGAAEHMLVAEVSNLTQTLKKLHQQQLWITGLAFDTTAMPYHKANLSGAIAVVVGNEGDGLSRLVKTTCDFTVKIPMRGNIESLNASVACSLILYEVWRARGFDR